MATAAVLALLDENTSKAAFESSLARLKAAPKGVEIGALDICVRLLPSQESVDSNAGSTSRQEELWDIILGRLIDEQSSPDRLYKIAETCLTHESVDHLKTKINRGLSAFTHETSSDILVAKAYLAFLKCSFWLQQGQHLANSETLRLISSFISIHGLEETAHDTLSALFSLLRNNTVLNPNGSLIDQSLWHQINALDIESFTIRSSKIFRTWFQWISQAASDGVIFDCVNDEQYWKKLRLGLVHGHADQRKYCLGILRQSLIVTAAHIDTSSMQYGANNLDRERYDLYTTLYETIVLHRYTGQVEDCLSSLTRLLGSTTKETPSKITPAMATTLLTAALDPLIQESIRKMIGRWYMDFVVEVSKHHPQTSHVRCDIVMRALHTSRRTGYETDSAAESGT
jgi:tRNA guanosine-2'-O-methyltransferase